MDAQPKEFYLRRHQQVHAKAPTYLPVKNPRNGDVRAINTEHPQVRDIVERLKVITCSGSLDDATLQEAIELLE